MSDLPDLREQIAALFRSAPGETRLGDEPPGLIADAVLGVLPEGWDRFVRTIQVLRDQAERLIGEREEAWEEIRRLRREVDFEANGADTFSGADLKAAELATPDEWSKRFGVKVWDPDGWRSDGKAWDEPISKAEFERRLAVSTVGPSVHPEGGGS
jgi:hypothetical protein